jgi:hypothetical protein
MAEDTEDTIVVRVMRNCSDGNCSYDKGDVVRAPRNWALKVMKEFIIDNQGEKSFPLVESNEADLKKFETDRAKKSAKE